MGNHSKRSKIKNIIILTSGLSGSSVLAATIASSGLWAGKSTIAKHDYNTWENTDLVKLNNLILENANVSPNWTMVFDCKTIDKVKHSAASLNPTDFRNFIAQCQAHSPWIWKDPRLTLTIRYWMQFIDTNNTCFILLKRDPIQAWISTTLRRQIQTLSYSKKYNEGIHNSLIEFAEAHNVAYLDITYEDLITQPESSINKINELAGTQITLNDIKTVFTGKLYKRQHGIASFTKALLIHMKNFHLRYK